jgi:hypothetical protein
MHGLAIVPIVALLSGLVVAPAAADTAPSVTTQPTLDLVRKIGDRASFTAAASGNPAPSVQWQIAEGRDGPWRDMFGFTSPTLGFTAQGGDVGRAYRAVFSNAAGTAITRPAKLVTRENWMRDLGDDIDQIPLTELTIPGSHDMGTYGVSTDGAISLDHQADSCSKSPDSICESWARAQSSGEDATAELNDGIRYFDLRICGNGDVPLDPYPPDFAAVSNDPVTCHGLVAAHLSTILQQTHDWAVAHPSELVILDFNHHFQIDQYMEAAQIRDALTNDGKSLLVPPQYCTPGDKNSGTCAGGLTLRGIANNGWGNVIVNFENDGAPGKTITDARFRDFDIQPILRSDFYDLFPDFWGRTNDAPHEGKYCTTAASFASCFGNTDDPGDALNSDRNTTWTRESFAEPHPAYTFEHFFVQFLQTTPDARYITEHLYSSLFSMTMDSNPVVGPGFFDCGSCFAQKLPENVNIVAINFYQVSDYGWRHFDFVAELLKFDEYARSAPVVGIAPSVPTPASGWYNAATLGGQGKKLGVDLDVGDYWYPTGVTPPDCLDGASAMAAPLGDGIHDLDCRAGDGANQGTHQAGNRGAGPGSTPMPYRLKVDTTAPEIHCPANNQFVLHQPVSSLVGAVTDATSGPAAASVSAPVSTASVGTFTAALSGADVAGNTASATCTYTVSYGVKLDYDATKANNAGSTVPISVELVDYNGVNLSSASILVTATVVRNLATGTTSSPVSPGGSSASLTFTTNSPRGYRYLLKTTGLGAGNYSLDFTAAGDPVTHNAPFVLR